MSSWLYAGLIGAGLPAICVGPRRLHAALLTWPMKPVGMPLMALRR
jgi:hypothetical protein